MILPQVSAVDNRLSMMPQCPPLIAPLQGLEEADVSPKGNLSTLVLVQIHANVGEDLPEWMELGFLWKVQPRPDDQLTRLIKFSKIELLFGVEY